MKIFQILFCTVAVNASWWDDIWKVSNTVSNAVSNTVANAVDHFKPNVFGFNVFGIFKEENYAALRKVNAYNMDLYRVSAYPASIDVEWTQHSRCFWKCSAKFYEWEYVPDGFFPRWPAGSQIFGVCCGRC